jgi:hypothetical protein
MTTNQRKQAALARGRLLVAEIIMSDTTKFPPGSLMREVAEMTLKGGVNIRAELERRAGIKGRNRGANHE